MCMESDSLLSSSSIHQLWFPLRIIIKNARADLWWFKNPHYLVIWINKHSKMERNILLTTACCRDSWWTLLQSERHIRCGLPLHWSDMSCVMAWCWSAWEWKVTPHVSNEQIFYNCQQSPGGACSSNNQFAFIEELVSHCGMKESHWPSWLTRSHSKPVDGSKSPIVTSTPLASYHYREVIFEISIPTWMRLLWSPWRKVLVRPQVPLCCALLKKMVLRVTASKYHPIIPLKGQTGHAYIHTSNIYCYKLRLYVIIFHITVLVIAQNRS